MYVIIYKKYTLLACEGKTYLDIETSAPEHDLDAEIVAARLLTFLLAKGSTRNDWISQGSILYYIQ